ncbi:MAG: hypothetical protein B7Y99_04395 [Caulobacterales bacterium 32-69-10]|nr:MAG: hypothetical protein B7Y99_04395 [Caulobacterales bacterium 32-69-10]
MTLWLVRHGQTTFNAEGRIQGANDSPLTALGEAQAARVGRLLADLTGHESDRVMWCSPQGRARRTAEIIRETAGITGPLLIEPRLREITLGSWDGLTDEEIESVTPGACERATRYDWYFRSPDGETHAEIQERLGSWLAEMAQGSGCRIIVSHGLSGRVLRGLYAGMDPMEALKLDVPQDAVFRLDGGQIKRFDARA